MAAALLTALSLFVWGCSILIVSGPDHVRTGDPASFVVRIDSGSGSTGSTIYVAVDIPVSWSFLRNAYVTNQADFPAEAGVGRETADPGISGFPASPVAAGSKRLFFKGGPVDHGTEDFVDVHFEFLAGGSPGTRDVTFWTAGESFGNHLIGGSATKTVEQYAGPESPRRTGLFQPSNRSANFFSDDETGQRLAEDVIVSTTTGMFYLRRVEVTGLYAAAPATSFFTVAVYNDSAGLPGSLVGEFENLQASEVATGAEHIGYPEQRFVVELPEIVELPNGVYWVAVNDQTPSFDFGWLQADVDPVAGRPGLAASFGDDPWSGQPGLDVALRLLGSEHAILFQDAFEAASSMQAELTCGAPGAGEAQIVDSCPWGMFAPTPGSVAVWGDSTCTQYGTDLHRASFSTPAIDVSACPAGTQAVLEVDYLLQLQEPFRFDRAFIEATVDGVPRILATNPSGALLGGDSCSPRPEFRGGLVGDRKWRHATLLMGTGDHLTVTLAGEVVDGVSNLGAGFLIDDLWVRCGPELFFDGFESGNTSAWSATSP